VRLATNQGPAAARMAGFDHVRTPFVAFVDTDAQVAPGWLEGLLAHMADPRLGLVAPRLVSPARAGASVLRRYEAVRSPLDLGARPGPVAPGSRIGYVPGAAVLVRAAALRAVDGFDPALRLGEDVDLVWRLHAAGWRCRYEPAVEVEHRPRPDLRSFTHQRFGYGRSAGALATRHDRAVAPVRAGPLPMAGWALTAIGHPIAGAAAGLSAAAPLARRFGLGAEGALTAAVVTGYSLLSVGRQLAGAVTRPWWPMALAAATVSRRARWALAAATLLPAMADYGTSRPRVDPLRYLALRVVDDAAYGAGVWRGAVEHRTLVPFLPALVSRPRGSGRRGPRPARRSSPR
jgi:mycofactocin glycosyltransferase